MSTPSESDARTSGARGRHCQNRYALSNRTGRDRGGRFLVAFTQPVAKLSERLAAMRDREFARIIDLAERVTVRRVEEDRVVAEAVRALRARRDLTLDPSLGGEPNRQAVGVGRLGRDERQRADE